MTNDVLRLDPSNCTTEFETKPVPFTVSVNAASPAHLVSGEMPVVAGTGLLTVNVCGFDSPSAGLKTVMLKEPAVVRSPAGMLAVTSVELTNDVARSDPPKRTTEVVS